MLWRLLTVALLATGLITAVACGGDDDDDASGDDSAATTAPADDATDSAATETEPEPADDGEGEGADLFLQAADFSFTPATLTAGAGDAITLTVTNAGNASHTFTSEDLSIDETVAPGESKVIEFTFPDAEAAFLCKFHSQMIGSLIAQ